MKALGFIETNGFVAATEAADSALKAANVSLAGQYRPGSGLVAVIITGDVAAVKAAVEAGAASAATIGRVLAAQVIARPHEGMSALIGEGPVKEDAREQNEAKPKPRQGKASPGQRKRSPGV